MLNLASATASNIASKDAVPLQRQISSPLYRQLKDTLEIQIRSGVYQRHERLPSERELSDRFGVSRMTARHALLALASDGAVYTQIGKGTFGAAATVPENRQLTREPKSYRDDKK